MLRVTIIVNGSKPSAMQKAEAYSAFCSGHCTFQIVRTQRQGHAVTLASEWSSRSDIIAVFGGDGTLSESINGLMHVANTGQEQLPHICLVPCGTGNDFARNFAQIHTAEDFLKTLLNPKAQSIDVIEAVCKDGSKKYVTNAGDAGFGAAVVEHLEKNRSKHPLFRGFGWSILHTFSFYRKKELTVKTDRASWKGNALLVAFNSGKYFGNGIGISPDASPLNGQLQITIIGAVSVWEYLIYLPRLRRCEKINHPEVHYLNCQNAIIEGQGSTEFDGELGPKLPIEIRVLPNALTWLELPKQI
jgi:diacylglycerol kinase (ATP)